MSIAFTKYVDILSGVAGLPQVPQRELIGRLFSINQLIPTKSFAEFTDAESVGDYFGFNSEEYFRAQFYFGFVSKQVTSPQKISFARWANVPTAPQIFGEKSERQLSEFTVIVDGSLVITLGGITENIVGMNFAAALSFADVAATVQAAIQAANVDPLFSGATVVYDAIAQRFNLTGGNVGPANVEVGFSGIGTDIGDLIGWSNFNGGTIYSDGVNAEPVTQVLSESAEASNNFGSYLFMPPLTEDELEQAASFALGSNVRFQFYHAVFEMDAAATFALLEQYDGTGIMIKSTEIPFQFPEMMPMCILAATDFNRRAANQNYMYYQFNIAPVVTDTTVSNQLDFFRMNYYGQTQQAGRPLSFFQRGVLMGRPTAPRDMNTYANEQWFKDAAGVVLMNLNLASPGVPANDSGRVEVLGVLQSPIDQALLNGTISVDKPLTAVQQATITQITGDPNAWRQVQGIGYWVDAAVVPNPLAPEEFQITYLLVYAKGDIIRRIQGAHTLI